MPETFDSKDDKKTANPVAKKPAKKTAKPVSKKPAKKTVFLTSVPSKYGKLNFVKKTEKNDFTNFNRYPKTA